MKRVVEYKNPNDALVYCTASNTEVLELDCRKCCCLEEQGLQCNEIEKCKHRGGDE